jgi:pimeloyl-ACP methyl ester carboxylesterase
MKASQILPALLLGLSALLASACSPPKLDDFLYDPLKAPPGGYQLSTAVIPAATELRLATPDGQTLQGYFIPAGGTYPDITLIYFHGQSNNVGTSWPRLEYLYPLGCNILAVDVRGYGLSTGSPDEPGIDIDVQTIWDAAVGATTIAGITPVAPDHVIVYGRSLGAAFAVQLAYSQSGSGSLTPPGALITESAFTSVAALVRDGVYVDLPAGFVARSSWDSLTKIHSVQTNYLAVHGGADSYVLPRYSQELADAHAATVLGHPTAVLFVPRAGHDDVPQAWPLAKYQGELGCRLMAIDQPATQPDSPTPCNPDSFTPDP